MTSFLLSKYKEVVFFEGMFLSRARKRGAREFAASRDDRRAFPRGIRGISFTGYYSIYKY